MIDNRMGLSSRSAFFDIAGGWGFPGDTWRGLWESGFLLWTRNRMRLRLSRDALGEFLLARWRLHRPHFPLAIDHYEKQHRLLLAGVGDGVCDIGAIGGGVSLAEGFIGIAGLQFDAALFYG